MTIFPECTRAVSSIAEQIDRKMTLWTECCVFGEEAVEGVYVDCDLKRSEQKEKGSLWVVAVDAGLSYERTLGLQFHEVRALPRPQANTIKLWPGVLHLPHLLVVVFNRRISRMKFGHLAALPRPSRGPPAALPRPSRGPLAASQSRCLKLGASCCIAYSCVCVGHEGRPRAAGPRATRVTYTHAATRNNHLSSI